METRRTFFQPSVWMLIRPLVELNNPNNWAQGTAKRFLQLFYEWKSVDNLGDNFAVKLVEIY